MDTVVNLVLWATECAVRYKYIEKSLDEGSAKFKKLESLLWGVYPFIVGTVLLAKYF